MLVPENGFPNRKYVATSPGHKTTCVYGCSPVPSPTLESGSGSPYIQSWVSVTSYYITKRKVSTWPFV